MISKNPTMAAFELFGTAHIATVLIVMGLFVLFTYLTKYQTFRKWYKRSLLGGLLFLDIGYRVWSGFYETPNYVGMFSIHISSAAVYLCVWLLVKYNQKVFDVLFYWAFITVPQAIITPGLGRFGFPHYRFFHMFLLHFMIIFTVVYFMKAEKKVLSEKHLFRVLIVTHCYGIFVMIINGIFSTNYMFIGRKTDLSLIEYMPEWPYYVWILDAMLIGLFILLNRLYRLVERKKHEHI